MIASVKTRKFSLLVFSVTFFFTAAVLLTGCSGNKVEPAPESVPGGVGTIDFDDLDAVYEVYVKSSLQAGVLTKPWDNSTEIDPDSLVSFYALEQLRIGEEGAVESFPAKELEAYVRRYFDLSEKGIRKSTRYDSKEKVYSNIGTSDVSGGRVVHVTQEDGKLLLTYESFINEELTSGSLTVEVTDTGFRFLSNTHTAQ